MRRRILRISRILLKERTVQLCIVSAFIFGMYIAALQLSDNFHEVIPGELYRSAQLEEGEIVRLKQKYGIKTILNLRGDNTGREWYDLEVKEARQANINHIDFKMKANKALSKERVEELVRIMRDAPKPLLIHCQGGADRSGLASALYLSIIKNKIDSESEEQLSILYGHMPTNESDAMCQSFDLLKFNFSRQLMPTAKQSLEKRL